MNQFPTTMDELYLILENESKFHALVAPVVEKLALDVVHFMARARYLREVIRQASGKCGYPLTADRQIITSKLCAYFVERYGGDDVAAYYRENVPTWVRVQIEYGSNSTSVLQKRTVLEMLANKAKSINDGNDEPTPPTRKEPKPMEPTNGTSTSRECSQKIGEVFNPKAPAVEVKTFVFGLDASNLTEDQLFAHIARMEAEIKQLSTIENKPKKLVARIDKLKADIAALIKVIDGDDTPAA